MIAEINEFSVFGEMLRATFISALPTGDCTVMLLYGLRSGVVLCAAFLCLSDWLMLLLYTVLFCHCVICLKMHDDEVMIMMLLSFFSYF